MAQRFAKALGIGGGSNPRLRVVEDLFLDALVETAQIPFDPRIIFNCPGQGFFAVDAQSWVFADPLAGIRPPGDLRSLQSVG